MSVQTIEDFLAKGGSITKCDPSRGLTTSEFIKRDAQLIQLRKLAKVVTDDAVKQKIENAIDVRYQILKCSF